jgi:beta-N-acetylhexosaminidase
MVKMTLEEKIGQMIMVGFHGAEAGADARRLITEVQPGSVILFAYSGNMESPAQIARLTNQLQSLARAEPNAIPLLIATDEEGGLVTRLPKGTQVPGNMALGASQDADSAYRLAKLKGKELSAVGINMNLAPDLDVNVNPANPVIGVRSFGEDPNLVATLGMAAVRGFSETVVATVKHFPGHGDTNVDSHVGLPVINKTRAELDATELVPFKQAIAAGVEVIMSAHISVPALDPTPSLPATLSQPILTGLLRNTLGYKGVVITDSMAMAGAANYYGGIPKAAVKAVEAGADILLLTPEIDTDGQIAVFQAVLSAVQSGSIPASRIDESARRIIALKMKHQLFSAPNADEQQVDAVIGTKASRDESLGVARKAITLLKNANVLPLKTGQQVLVVSQFDIATLLRPTLPGVSSLKLSGSDPKDDEISTAVRTARSADVVVVTTVGATLHPKQVTLVKELLNTGKPVVVVGCGTPYEIARFPGVGAYIAAYAYNNVALTAAAETLLGTNHPVGKLPVTVPGVYKIGYGLALP